MQTFLFHKASLDWSVISRWFDSLLLWWFLSFLFFRLLFLRLLLFLLFVLLAVASCSSFVSFGSSFAFLISWLIVCWLIFLCWFLFRLVSTLLLVFWLVLTCSSWLFLRGGCKPKVGRSLGEELLSVSKWAGCYFHSAKGSNNEHIVNNRHSWNVQT